MITESEVVALFAEANPVPVKSAEPDTPFELADSEPDELGGDERTVDWLHHEPVEGEVSSDGRGWRGALFAVAAAILILVGLVVVDDGNGGDIVTDPAWVPSADDSVSQHRWTRVPHDDAVFGSFQATRTITEMKGVTVGGPGFVAVGGQAWDDSGDWLIDDGEAVVWTSVDGVTWSRVPHDEAVFGGAAMFGVAAGGPGLVAIGVDHPLEQAGSWSPPYDGEAAVWTSVDGISWSRVPHDEAVFGGAMISSVAAGGPGLVVVGRAPSGDAAVWTSVDGVTWSRVPHDEAVFGGAAMFGVTAGGPGLVAVGVENYDAAVWTSVDGVTWSRVRLDDTVFDGGGPMVTVTDTGQGLVAIGPNGLALWTSDDGLAWSRASTDDRLVPPHTVWGDSVSGIVGGPALVAVGGATPPGSCCGDVAAVWVGVESPMSDQLNGARGAVQAVD